MRSELRQAGSRHRLADAAEFLIRQHDAELLRLRRCLTDAERQSANAKEA